MLSAAGMEKQSPPHAVTIEQAVEGHLHRRLAEIMSPGGPISHAKRFSWCGELLDYLAQGVDEKLADMGITLQDPYPGPMNLLDEDQHPDGSHVRRFWTVALKHGCPIAKLCTIFFHRHDRIDLPKPPRVVALPPDDRTSGEEIAG